MATEPNKFLPANLEGWERIALILIVAVFVHLLVILLKKGWKNFIIQKSVKVSNYPRTLTVAILIQSVLIFGLYFGAFGFILSELGISLKAYLASASILGLAVAFGSQGFVQDVVTGLTVIFSDLCDVGDMVEVSGQTGIIQRVGLRFTVIVNSIGAEVAIPNRNIANVVKYPSGYSRTMVDITLPEDEALAEKAETLCMAIANGTCEQYPGPLLSDPTNEGRRKTPGGRSYLRIKFRHWPGRIDLITGSFKPEAVAAMTKLIGEYSDWMIAANAEVEEKTVALKRRRARVTKPAVKPKK